MFIEAVNNELDSEFNKLEKNEEGSDGQRMYILLESGEYCNSCFKNSSMKELGIEKISFQVYQLAEEKSERPREAGSLNVCEQPQGLPKAA